MATYEHNGIKIEFNERTGKFTATIKSKSQTAASLSGIKKKIDDAAKNSFQPFPALIWPLYNQHGKAFISTRVVGIIKARGRHRYNARDKWEIAGGGEHQEVMVDTPANRDAIKAYYDWQKETQKLRDKRAKAAQELRDKIVTSAPGGK